MPPERAYVGQSWGYVGAMLAPRRWFWGYIVFMSSPSFPNFAWKSSPQYPLHFGNTISLKKLNPAWDGHTPDERLKAPTSGLRGSRKRFPRVGRGVGPLPRRRSGILKNYPGKRPQTVLRCFLIRNRGCQVRVRISASESCSTTSARSLCQDFCVSSLYRATCARSLCVGLLSKISLSGSLRQGPLAQDHCMRLSCARCLSGCRYQEPLGPLVQDHCMRLSCARCPCQDLLSRIL